MRNALITIGSLACILLLVMVTPSWKEKPNNTITFRAAKTEVVSAYVGIPIASKQTTDANGLITVTYQNPYTVTPNIQANIANGAATSRQFIRVYDNTAAGFKCQVYSFNTVSLLGIDVLAGANVPVSGAVVDLLITAMQ